MLGSRPGGSGLLQVHEGTPATATVRSWPDSEVGGQCCKLRWPGAGELPQATPCGLSILSGSVITDEALASVLDRDCRFCQFLVVGDKTDYCRRCSVIDGQIGNFERSDRDDVAMTLPFGGTGTEVPSLAGIVFDCHCAFGKPADVAPSAKIECVNARRQICYDPVPESRAGWSIAVVHRNKKAFGSCRLTRPADSRRNIPSVTPKAI
jgi:hypothetical protein